MTSSESPYRLEEGDGYSALALSPELDQAQWADIQEIGDDVLSQLGEQPSPAFLVDLSALSYMGSSMVALIVRIWKSVKQRNGRMVVVNRHEFVLEVLTLAGLNKVWSIVETREEALRELGCAKPFRGRLPAAFWQAVIGLLALVGGGSGVVLLLAPPGTVDQWVGPTATFGCAAVGLIVGMFSVVRQSGGYRDLGIFVVVASLVLVVTGIFKMSGILG